jgi:hypothetical protein
LRRLRDREREDEPCWKRGSVTLRLENLRRLAVIENGRRGRSNVLVTHFEKERAISRIEGPGDVRDGVRVDVHIVG